MLASCSKSGMATAAPRVRVRPMLTRPCVSLRAAVRKVDNPVVPFVIPIPSPAELWAEQTWVATQITTWLNEEWVPMEVNSRLGAASGDAYARLRANGQTEMGDILLDLSAALGVSPGPLADDFKDSFTGAFEVANKVIELVMMRAGCDVCCTSDADRERMERVSSELESKP